MISIGGYVFDIHEGSVMTPQKRVVSYARSDIAQAGAAVLPKVGDPFEIRTITYRSVSLVNDLRSNLDNLIGTVVAVTDDWQNYSLSPYFVNFIVQRVQHAQIVSVVRARGSTNGVPFDLSPAARLTSTWTFQAVPI